MTPEELFESHIRLVYWVLYRYFPSIAEDEDMRQLALIGLWRACLRYDPSFGCQFSTLAVKYVRLQVGRELTKMRYKKRNQESLSVSLNQPMDYDDDFTFDNAMLSCVGWEDDIAAKIDMEGAMEKLKPGWRAMLLGVASGATQTEIAKRLGISPQAVSLTCSKARKQLAALMG